MNFFLKSFLIASCLTVLPLGRAGLAYEFSPPPGWQRGNIPAVEEQWTREERKESITILRKPGKPGEIPQAASIDKFLQKLKDDRGLLLSLLGITDWTVTSRETARDGDRTVLRISGGYTNTAGGHTYFNEWQYYGPEDYLQITLHYEDPGGPLAPEEARALLSRFKVGEVAGSTREARR